MYMSSPNAMRMAAMGSKGERRMKGVFSPMTPAQRSGCISGICQTMMPPQSWPQKTAFSTPRWSISPTRSPVRCSMS